MIRKKIREVVERHIASGAAPGAVVVLVRHGEVVCSEAAGIAGPHAQRPLAPDDIFWLASMTKPVIAAAVLALQEDRKLDINEAVAHFIPEFEIARQVRNFHPMTGRDPGELPYSLPFSPDAPDPEHDLVKASRPLVLRDLLTHTSGLQTLFVPNTRVPNVTDDDTLASYVPRLASVPLDFQPGARWAYSNVAGYEVLARVVEVVSGTTLGAYLQSRLLDPLGMHDTGFGRGEHPRAVPAEPMLANHPVPRGTAFQSGNAGLWGSAPDYLRFAEMLRCNGVGPNGRGRVLAESSVALMHTNLVGGLKPLLNGRNPGPGIGFGLGVAIAVDSRSAGLSVPSGSFGWDGLGTRRFWVAPSAGTSLFMYAPTPELQHDIETIVFAE